jgi:hypothetical protein
VKKSKCSIGGTTVAYLGHVISAQGGMDVGKVEVVQAWQQPHMVHTIRGFLSLTGYYWKFNKGYGEIAGPLT